VCCCHWDAQQGSPLPWLAASQQLEVLAVVDPHDAATVCLELCGGAVQITYHAAERIVDVCGSEAVRNQDAPTNAFHLDSQVSVFLSRQAKGTCIVKRDGCCRRLRSAARGRTTALASSSCTASGPRAHTVRVLRSFRFRVGPPTSLPRQAQVISAGC